MGENVEVSALQLSIHQQMMSRGASLNPWR